MDSAKSLIDFIDHITTVLEPQELRSLSQALFKMGLTPGWPLSEQPGFSTAGIRFGNLNLELCSVDRQANPLDSWLTFEPVDLSTLASDLAARDIRHDPFDAVVIHGNPIYTRVEMPALSSSFSALQLCRTFVPTRTTGPVAPENAAGIQHVHTVKVVMDSSNRELLNQLMAADDSSETILFKEGPALSVASASMLKVQGFVVSARDPEHAASVLAAAGLKRTSECVVQIGSLDVELTD